MTLLYNTLLHLISTVISLYISYSFFETYFTKRADKKTVVITFSLMTAILTAMLVFLFDIILVRLIVSILSIFGVCTMYKMKWHYRLLMPLLLYALLAICENLSGALLTVLFQIDMKTSVTGKYFVIGLFLSKLISFLAIKLLYLTKYKFTRIRLTKSTIATILVPVSTISVILLQYGFIYNSTEISLSTSFLSLFCYLTLILSNFFVFDWIDHIAKEVERDTKLAAANEVITIQKKHYDAMIGHNRDIQKLKHDQKNTYLGLLIELRHGNYDKVISAVQSELDIICDNSFNYADDASAIITYKSNQAKNKGIHLDADLSGTGGIKIPTVDLFVILGNLLDNAIEATERVTDRDRRIALSIKNTKGTVVITIKNPAEKDVDVDRLTSTKNDHSSHGFGILSIRSIAEKYYGEVIFACSEREFTSTVVMRNIS